MTYVNCCNSRLFYFLFEDIDFFNLMLWVSIPPFHLFYQQTASRPCYIWIDWWIDMILSFSLLFLIWVIQWKLKLFAIQRWWTGHWAIKWMVRQLESVPAGKLDLHGNNQWGPNINSASLSNQCGEKWLFTLSVSGFM